MRTMRGRRRNGRVLFLISLKILTLRILTPMLILMIDDLSIFSIFWRLDILEIGYCFIFQNERMNE